MTMRNAFYPLLGDVVNGLFGDFIDCVHGMHHVWRLHVARHGC